MDSGSRVATACSDVSGHCDGHPTITSHWCSLCWWDQGDAFMVGQLAAAYPPPSMHIAFVMPSSTSWLFSVRQLSKFSQGWPGMVHWGPPKHPPRTSKAPFRTPISPRRRKTSEVGKQTSEVQKRTSEVFKKKTSEVIETTSEVSKEHFWIRPRTAKMQRNKNKESHYVNPLEKQLLKFWEKASEVSKTRLQKEKQTTSEVQQQQKQLQKFFRLWLGSPLWKLWWAPLEGMVGSPGFWILPWGILNWADSGFWIGSH